MQTQRKTLSRGKKNKSGVGVDRNTAMYVFSKNLSPYSNLISKQPHPDLCFSQPPPTHFTIYLSTSLIIQSPHNSTTKHPANLADSCE